MTLPKGILGYHPPPSHPEAIPTPMEIHTEELGERVPLKSNDHDQWIAATGMILRVLVGSTVHGTAIDGVDDEDQMAICVEPPRTLIGLASFTHYEFRTAVEREGIKNGCTPSSGPGDLDLTVYSLRRYAKLAGSGNPTVLLPLFVPESAIFYINDIGRELRENRDMLLSKQAGERFKHYCQNQVRGMLGERSTPSRKALRDEFGWDPKYGMHAVRLGIQGAELLADGKITLPMKPTVLKDLRALRRGELSKEWALERTQYYGELIDKLMTTTKLPDQPDWQRINSWLIDVHLRHWGLK